jgi:hypothetical protein
LRCDAHSSAVGRHHCSHHAEGKPERRQARHRLEFLRTGYNIPPDGLIENLSLKICYWSFGWAHLTFVEDSS